MLRLCSGPGASPPSAPARSGSPAFHLQLIKRGKLAFEFRNRLSVSNTILDWAARSVEMGFSYYSLLYCDSPRYRRYESCSIIWRARDSKNHAIPFYLEQLLHARRFVLPSTVGASPRNKPILVIGADRSPRSNQSAEIPTAGMIRGDAVIQRAGRLWQRYHELLFVQWKPRHSARPLRKATGR